MKIDRSQLQKVTGAYRAGTASPNVAGKEAGVAKGAEADRVNVSEKARTAAVLKAKIKETPEVRTELVERIKAQIEAGKYNVDPKKIAEKLLKSKVLDE